jgi:hypothetical protein
MGFQNPYIDLEGSTMEAVASLAVPGGDFHSSIEQFYALTRCLGSPEARAMDFSDLEKKIEMETRELKRRLLQEHLNSRGLGDVGKSITGSDQAERSHKRERERGMTSLFGEVRVGRVGYSAHGVTSLFPKDAVLNLPEDSFSHGVRRAVAIEAARGSFDEACASVERATGLEIGKRQAENLARRAAQDFYAFYEQAATPQALASVKTLPLQILSVDGKGIVMRHEDLREATRLKAEETQPKLKTRASKGEKLNAKRMATVAAIYNVDTFIRTPEQVVGALDEGHEILGLAKAPRPCAKRIWASIEKEQTEVIEDLFQAGLARDPGKKKRWICLVDGDPKQLKRLRAAAKRHGVAMTLVLDIIHVIEYLWKAARVFHPEASPECETWVTERLLEILRGNSSHVAAGMRRSATLREIPTAARKPVDTAAGYLLNNAPYLRYDEYLSSGLPIATGVIEGACRHLVKDRMDVTGARWSLEGAEAVLKLRSLRSSQDFEAYWQFHERQEQRRNHHSRYAKPSTFNKLKLSVVKNS